MNSEYAYGVDDSERAHLVPNLRIIASQPFIGLTAYLGNEPHLVIGREDENSYLMEDQFGHRKVVDFIFPWEMPKVESNKLVAASRVDESPFREIGYLYYDEETGEWAVRVGTSNMRYPLEEKISSLEEQGWSKFADIGGPSGVDVGGDFGHGHSGPSHGEHPGAGELAPTIEVRAACPHCHSDQHLELATDNNHPHSDEKKYVCHNCGKWSHEHELEVSDHDKGEQDQNPEDVSYEEHSDDAERHQDDHDDEHKVHDNDEKFDFDSDRPRKKKSSTAFTIQGVTFNEGKSARGQAIKLDEEGKEGALQHIETLPTAFDKEKEYVKQRYQEQGFPAEYKYDNPFINRGGSIKEAETYRDRMEAIPQHMLPPNWQEHYGPGELDQPFQPNRMRVPEVRQPSAPEHFSADGAILCTDELTPDDFEIFSHPGVTGILLSRGGPGSHAVYVATTMGLACVLVRPEEMARIHPGDYLDIDGTTGVIHINGGVADFQVRTQDEVRNEADYDLYRFAYANGQGHVEEMIPGQMTGDKGGHQGMIGMLMASGHAQIDPETYEHNATYGFFTKKGVIVQDINTQLPDQEQFVNWAHAEEAALGLPRGPVRREDISAYGVTAGPSIPAAPAGNTPVSGPGAEDDYTGGEGQMAYAYVTGEETNSGGPKPKDAVTCPHCGSHTVEVLSTDNDKGNAEWLCLTCDNTFKADYRRHAAAKHPKGTRVQVTHPTKKGLKGSIKDHAGTDDNFGDDLYDLLLDNGDELNGVPEIHFTKIKSASVKTAAHIKTYLPNNSWHNGCSMLAGKAGLKGQVHYPLTGATLPLVGAGMPHIMQTFLPEHANLGGNNNIPIDVDVNDPEKFWQIWDAPGEGGGGGTNRQREEEAHQNVAHIVVIAALHDEVADYAQMIAKATDQDPDEIASDLADKGMIHSDEEWEEVRALVNHARGKNPAALSSMQKGAPYPEKSYHNAPDHSPNGQEWPAEVNAVYNACMREGGKSKSSCAAIAWSQYHKSVKEHGHGTSESEGKKKEGDYQPNVNPGAAGNQQPGQQVQQTPPCPHCGSPTQGTPQNYYCPNCGYSYPQGTQGTSPSAATPGVPGAPAPQGQTFHSHIANEEYPGAGYGYEQDVPHTLPDLNDEVTYGQGGFAGEPHHMEMFKFLDHLRESGVTNMFGASPYLQEAFGISPQEAKQILGEWMRTFGQRQQNVKSAALSVGEWYTMYSPDYKVPDVIQVVDVNDQGVTANIEGDDKGIFPITLQHDEIEKAGYKFEPYSNPSQVKTARRSFTVQEQNDLVNENLEGKARNFHKLNLEGTHYPQEIEASVDPLNEEFWLW